MKLVGERGGRCDCSVPGSLDARMAFAWLLGRLAVVVGTGSMSGMLNVCEEKVGVRVATAGPGLILIEWRLPLREAASAKCTG